MFTLVIFTKVCNLPWRVAPNWCHTSCFKQTRASKFRSSTLSQQRRLETSRTTETTFIFFFLPFSSLLLPSLLFSTVTYCYFYCTPTEPLLSEPWSPASRPLTNWPQDWGNLLVAASLLQSHLLWSFEPDSSASSSHITLCFCLAVLIILYRSILWEQYWKLCWNPSNSASVQTHSYSNTFKFYCAVSLYPYVHPTSEQKQAVFFSHCKASQSENVSWSVMKQENKINKLEIWKEENLI